MSNITRPGRCLGLLALVLAGACTDSSPVLPSPEGAESEMALVTCTANVQSGTMECVTQQPAQSRLGLNLNRILGGQERLIKLTSSNVFYTPADSIIAVDVTLQNLMSSALGTSDGVTATGIQVFFHIAPAVTTGSGSVAVANPDGSDVFLSGEADYFQYNEILQPYQISGTRNWKFKIAPTVSTFSFQVYVSAQLSNELTLIDAQWTGATDSLWATATNWSNGTVPDSLKVVAIPADSLLSGSARPTLTANASAAALRVGFGSVLDLKGFTLRVGSNVDATGSITGGTLQLSGSAALLGGNLPSVVLTGSRSLQAPVKATGAVSIQGGALNVAGKPLSIQIP